VTGHRALAVVDMADDDQVKVGLLCRHEIIHPFRY